MKIEQGYCPKCGTENELSVDPGDYDDGCHFYHMECPKCGCLYDEIFEEIYTGISISDDVYENDFQEADCFVLAKAAPELLEACKIAFKAVTRAHVDGEGRQSGCEVCRSLDYLEQAIQKATGE